MLLTLACCSVVVRKAFQGDKIVTITRESTLSQIACLLYFCVLLPKILLLWRMRKGRNRGWAADFVYWCVTGWSLRRERNYECPYVPVRVSVRVTMRVRTCASRAQSSFGLFLHDWLNPPHVRVAGCIRTWHSECRRVTILLTNCPRLRQGLKTA